VIPLDSEFWNQLKHAYGPASDIPGLLRHLSQNTGPMSGYKDEPWYSLWSSLCHQGDVYNASYAAVPHIVQIGIKASGALDSGFFLLPACVEIARNSKRGPEVLSELSGAYFNALRGLHECAFRHASDDWNEGMARSVTAALSAAKGQFRLAEALRNLDGDILSKVIAMDI
jgi:hypothetical protein